MNDLLFQSENSLSSKVLNGGKCREFLKLKISVLFIRLPRSILRFQIIFYKYSEHTHQ